MPQKIRFLIMDNQALIIMAYQLKISAQKSTRRWKLKFQEKIRSKDRRVNLIQAVKSQRKREQEARIMT